MVPLPCRMIQYPNVLWEIALEARENLENALFEGATAVVCF